MKYAIEPASLVRALLNEILTANLDWEANRPWTRAVKRGLSKILEREDGLTDVLFSDPDKGVSEFMLDVVAWDREEGEGIVLAAECEWISTCPELVRDFEKLLVVKSSIKLMIFASYGSRAGQHDVLVEGLVKSFLSYKHHLAGERYIFVDFARPPSRRAFWFEVPNDGLLESLPTKNYLDVSQEVPAMTSSTPSPLSA